MLFINSPRTINFMANVDSFIESWDDQNHSYNLLSERFKKSIAGNINYDGVIGGIDGPTYSKFHKNFQDSLEYGIKDLVIHFAYHLNWITYTSCEGHNYSDHRIENSERHIGLLPRSIDEKEKILCLLTATIQRINSYLNKSPITINLVMDYLYDHNKKPFQIIDIYFSKAYNNSWDEYFQKLEIIYRNFLIMITKA